MKWLFLFAVLESQIVSASDFLPRDAIYCDLTEGRISLTESAPGEFSYSESVGMIGSPGAGLAKLKFQTIDDKCIVSVNYMGKEGSILSRDFTFTNGSPSGITSLKFFKTDQPQNVKCKFSKRYAETIGQCKAPTAENPGNKCFGEAGLEVPLTLSNASYISASENKHQILLNA